MHRLFSCKSFDIDLLEEQYKLSVKVQWTFKQDCYNDITMS